MRCRGWDDNASAKPRCERGQQPVGGKHLSSSSPEQCPPVPAGGRSLAHLLLSTGGERAPGIPGGPKKGVQAAGRVRGVGCIALVSPWLGLIPLSRSCRTQGGSLEKAGG